MNRPFFNKQKQAWYVWAVDSDGVKRQRRLAKRKNDAFEEWRRVMDDAERRQVGNPLYEDLASDYVDFANMQVDDGDLAEKTIEEYSRILDDFCESGYGEIPVMDLRPHHVTDWMMGKNWGPSTKHNAITAVKRVLGWATKEGRIPSNPLAGIERPRPRRRTTLVSDDAHRQMVEKAGSQPGSSKSDRQMRLVLIAMRKTGCRPQDICRATVNGVDPDVITWTIAEHKRRRHTEQPKVIYLSACMRTVTRMLMGDRESGPLFRGRRGALTVNAIRCRFRVLRDQLPDLPNGTVAYAYRHTWITEAMENDVNVATIAELVGTSVGMIEKHYGHLGQKKSHLIDAANAAGTSRKKQ